jgi:hypothetical protein
LINDQYTSTVRPDEAFRFAVGSFIENVWFVLSYIYTIVSRSFQTSHLESGLNNIIRLGYCLAYISTTFEMSISMSLWTYNKSRALKRSSLIVLRKEFFINRISSTLYSLTSINCVVTVRGVVDCRNLTDGRTDGHWLQK